MSIPEIKIVIDTSKSLFSGTNNQVKIIFRKYACSGKPGSPDFKIDITEIPLILNKKGNTIKAGSSKTYIFKDERIKDISYVKQFTLEKAFDFYGKVFGGSFFAIPIGLRVSNNWKVKRVRVYYNNTLVLDNNESNSETKAVWLDKRNYWITYPDPNNAGPNDCGVCGCETYQAPPNRFQNVGFAPEGVL